MDSTSLVFATMESQLSEDEYVLSTFMASAVSNNDLLWQLPISWFDDLYEYRSEDRLPKTTLETRSQPAGKKEMKWNEIKFLIKQNDIALHLL